MGLIEIAQESSLDHAGVKGMKWGVRKSRLRSGLKTAAKVAGGVALAGAAAYGAHRFMKGPQTQKFGRLLLPGGGKTSSGAYRTVNAARAGMRGFKNTAASATSAGARGVKSASSAVKKAANKMRYNAKGASIRTARNVGDNLRNNRAFQTAARGFKRGTSSLRKSGRMFSGKMPGEGIVGRGNSFRKAGAIRGQFR